MKFEWDENKRDENIDKHGIDFLDAVKIFDGPMLVDIDNREDYGEERLIGIGSLEHRIVVIVFTESVDTIRIISVRKALKHERIEFENAIKDELGEG